ncbi:hypothetical protein L1286_21555 [Pseudoalteromonas sp. SMS1]|uniref:hypothetical protein n=1 Tax=Pseudoalteromonas sp. SMS1 TaxID=2908894 RepID=UPI001F210A47|nr:hypothetical protein [Pseudoalteromonas sp. SMS1]MCF2860072.1 hypothetical protein [Pseudoalteromonas sp. SMS1]
MLKRSAEFITLFMFISLSACSDHKQTISFSEFEKSSKILNWTTQAQLDDVHQAALMMPFDDMYLKSRHELLYSVETESLTSTELATLDYLKIQERYPERFLVWPAHVNVLARAHGVVPDKLVDSWLKLVTKRLQEGQASKIALNRLEREQLLSFLSTTDYVSEEKAALTRFLKAYKVRSNIGLHQLPNGAEWYQSKLNFYLGEVIEPNELLTLLRNKTETMPAQVVNVTEVSTDITRPVILGLVANYCKERAGYNWRDGYVDIRRTLAQCDQEIPVFVLQSLALIAQVDIGIHLFGWSQQQAMHKLQSRLALNEVQAYAMLKNIVFHPATSAAIIGHIKALDAL